MVYHANSALEAEIVKGMIENQGVEAFTSGFYLQGGVGELSTFDACNVYVNAQDERLAQQIVQEYDQTL